MKFRLAIEASEKRLELIPETEGEKILLGTICDPNNVSPMRSSEQYPTAILDPVVSNDRVPYRKVVQLNIRLPSRD